MLPVIGGWWAARGAALALLLVLLLTPSWGLASGVKASNTPELVRQGSELYLEARYQEAQEVLRQALSQVGLSRPQRAEAQYWLGLTYLGQGYQSYALEALVEARRLDPNLLPDPQVMSPEAQALWQQAAPGSAPPASLSPAPAAQAPAPATPAPAPETYSQAPQGPSTAPAPGGYDQAPQGPAPAPAPDTYSQTPATGGYGQVPQDFSQAPAPDTYGQAPASGGQAPAPDTYGQAPVPGGQAPAPGFQETPVQEPASPPPPPTVWVSQLLTAQGMKGGRPQGVRSVFSPQDETIYLWFELHDASEPLELRAVWTYLEGEPQEIAQSQTRAQAGDTWGLFTCSLRPGQSWPQGRYRAEIFLGDYPLGAAFFSIQ